MIHPTLKMSEPTNRKYPLGTQFYYFQTPTLILFLKLTTPKF